MSVKSGFVCVVVCVAGILLLGGSASAQWSGATRVSQAVEPLGGGQNRGGVSTARCGNNVVVGFGDSEVTNNQSTAGYAVSSDGGRTFTDKGVLPVSPADNFGFGTDGLGDRGFGPIPFGPTVDHDLSVACANSTTFYYAAPLLEANVPQLCPAEGICSSISVSISRDGGHTFGLPITIDRRNIDNHQLDVKSIAVDPTTPNRLYVAYLDENGSPRDSDFIFPDCTGGNFVTEVRVASSSDGGKTWATHIVDHVCDASSNPETDGILRSPNVVVSPGGKRT
jgi:hypothetical protein